MNDLAEYFSNPFVVRGLIGIVLISINAALAGSFAAFRGSTFLVSGAAHAALGGAALVLVLTARGYIGDVSPLVGGTVFAVLLALIASHASNRAADESVDTAIGVGFAFSMALAVLLISLIPEAASRVWGILLGDLLLLTPDDLWLLGAMTVALGATFGLCWRPFIFISFDLEGAQAFGFNAARYNHLLFALIGLSTAILLKGVGAIVVFAMLVAPAATALLFARSVRATMIAAFLIALLSGLVALVVSNYAEVSVSALAALLASASYFVGRGVQAVGELRRRGEG